MIKLYFDIDGVICRNCKNYYNNPKSNKLNIKIIN